MRKNLAIILSVLCLFYSLPIATQASTISFVPIRTEYGSEIAPQGIGTGVAIFVAGILVGYIVDGVIIYETGQSAGEWVSAVLEYYNANKAAFDSGQMTTIHVSSSGRVHGGGGKEF